MIPRPWTVKVFRPEYVRVEFHRTREEADASADAVLASLDESERREVGIEVSRA